MLEALFKDVRYAFRALRGSPGFAAVAILSLGLGIGANTAIFSLIDAVILRSLPVSHPEELIQVVGKPCCDAFSNPVWEQLRDRLDVFSGIFAYGRWGFNLAAAGAAWSVNGNYVSGQYFDTLGIRAAAGRLLTAADDTRGCAGAAVLSYGFWQIEYGGRADVIGKIISIDRQPVEIIGVMEQGFNGVEVGGAADVIVPICAAAKLHNSGSYSLIDTNFSGVGWLQIVGRPKRGISTSQVVARLKTLAPEIQKSALERRGFGREDGRNWRPEEMDRYLKRSFDIQSASTGISWLRREYRQALTILMAAVGMVLLIACANIANLLLARGAARQREIAVRLAVGGSRMHIVRQMLTESLLLAFIGTILGIVFAEWSARLLVRFLDATLDLTLDTRVLAFTAAVTILTGLLFGIAPAWRGTRVDPQVALKANARGVIEGSKIGMGKMLVIAQVALSVLLVVGAGLLISTLWKLTSLDAGFERDNVLLVSVDLRSGNYREPGYSTAYLEMLEKLRTVPGVASASVSFFTPVCHCRSNSEVVVEGYAPKSREDAMVATNTVTDRYFETVGTRIIAGRDFNAHDTPTSPQVAIVGEAMARKYFDKTNPIGQRFRIRNGTTLGSPIEIVGVVQDAKYGSLRDEPWPFVFLPWGQGTPFWPLTGFELRASQGSPAALIPGVKEAFRQFNPAMSVDFKTLSSKVADSIQKEKLLAGVSGFFGGLALVLAAIGIYGVTSYNVARRRNEIGIRMALGAEQARVMRMILRETAILIGAGLAIGLIAAIAATRLVAAFLYGLKPNDPWTLALATAILALAAAVACFLPARRASRVDPMVALREE